MAGTVKKRCSCKHTYQDKKYGRGIRIHNVSLDGKKSKCTICGSTK